VFSQNLKREFLESIDQWSPDSLFLSIIGPTASGKTAAALVEARKIPKARQPLLVSVDAGAVYSGVDIGTAKPTLAEQEEFNWAGISFVPPRKPCDLNLFVSHAHPQIEQALSTGRAVWLVGGSHFYEQAFTQGQMPGAASDPIFLQSLSHESNLDLYSKLGRLDQRWAEKVHPNDRYRLKRFSDLVRRQGLSFDQLSVPVAPTFHRYLKSIPTLVLGDQVPRDVYESRIERRVHDWISGGWVDEVKALVKSGLDPEAPGLQVMGYPEVVSVVQGESTIKEVAPQIVTQHLQLVKKQKTWLRGLKSSRVDPFN
jgi:tRNA dimethylallyltransferase